ncbi:hypothetical protein [Halonotius sp. GCM10025705]|uniref:hypothetical protein n=1 Tax=Halonotius sp. GCM10025705 TaxID=3252678 RepID=UPI00361F4297
MTDVRSATAELLEAHPELEDDLRTLLTIDQNGPWTFDDVPLDSGLFGEVVAAGIVDSIDDTYRLRDPDAVRAAQRTIHQSHRRLNLSRTTLRSMAVLSDRSSIDQDSAGCVSRRIHLYLLRLSLSYCWSF